MKEVEEALDRAEKEIRKLGDPDSSAMVRAFIALHDAMTALAGLQEPEPDLRSRTERE